MKSLSLKSLDKAKYEASCELDDILSLLQHEKEFTIVQQLKKESEIRSFKRNQRYCEICNSITHGLGFLCFIPCGAALLLRATTLLQVISNIVYIFGVLGMFLSSTLLHVFYFLEDSKKYKKYYRALLAFDHINICLIIPAHYFTLMLNTLRNCYLGVIVLIVEYSLCILNVCVYFIGFFFSEIWLYLGMGWVALSIIPYFMWLWAGTAALPLLVSCGVSLTAGIVFYLIGKKFYWFHCIWHIFVIAGVYFAFFTVFFFDKPYEKMELNNCWMPWFSMK